MENNAKLAVKLLEIEKGLKYIKSDKKGNSNNAYVSRNAVLSQAKPLFQSEGVKFFAAVISSSFTCEDGKFKEANYYKESETTEATKNNATYEQGKAEPKTYDKDTNSITHQKAIIDRAKMYHVEAELEFTFMDTVTGYEKVVKWRGMWTERANIGFGLGALVSYAKRQFLIEFFNIETDEMEAEEYEIKNDLDTEKRKNNKNLQLLDMMKNAKSKAELDFAMEALPDHVRTFENEDYKNTVMGMYQKSKKKEEFAKKFNIPETLLK